MAWEANKPLVMEEIEVAPPQANEVRIKVRTIYFQDFTIQKSVVTLKSSSGCVVEQVNRIWSPESRFVQDF